MREKIEQAIKDALSALGAGEAAYVVERPRAMEHGDYATNAALVAKVDAQALADKLGTIEGVERVEVVGKFINFFLSADTIMRTVSKATEEDWGKNNLYKDKVVLVEYTSPNLFKPLHIGNLIGNILGESVSRLYAAAGADVKRINYPSDIGLTVAKGVWGLQKLGLNPASIADLGKAYVAGNDAYEDGSAKAEIEEINKALYEDSNPEWSRLRQVGIETSRRHLDELCEKLGTKFDVEFFESQAAPVGKELVLAHMDTVFEKSDGAVVYKGEQDGLHTRVFLNSQGLPTYEAKDLGLFELKRKMYPDFDITVTDTGPEQTEYFKVLYAAVRKLFPDYAGKSLLHTAHGFLKLTTGKMSSRKGNVITGESLIEDLVEESKEKMQGREHKDADKIAEQIAIGAIKYASLKQGNGRDIIFDPEKSLSLEGDSGPYLQYAHVRTVSLLKKASGATVTQLLTPQSKDLQRLLIHYPGAVARAAREMEPHHVTTYLTELASAFNTWYATERVIVDGKVAGYTLTLIKAVENTLAQGLQVLGIPAPEEM